MGGSNAKPHGGWPKACAPSPVPILSSLNRSTLCGVPWYARLSDCSLAPTGINPGSVTAYLKPRRGCCWSPADLFMA